MSEPYEWTDAACRQFDPELWFPAMKDRQAQRRAVAICDLCPVIAECREYAIRKGIPFGVWGGMTQLQRAKVTGIKPSQARKHDSHPLKPCGTVAAYRRHLRRGELPCEACSKANSRRSTDLRTAAANQ